MSERELVVRPLNWVPSHGPLPSNDSFIAGVIAPYSTSANKQKIVVFFLAF